MRKLLFGLPVLVAAAGVALFAVGMGGAAAGAVSAAGVQPEEVLQAEANACEGGKKVDGAGVYDLTYGTGVDAFTIHLTITTTPRDVGGPFIAFESDDPDELVTSIYVKGGNTANLYTYPGDGVQSDSLLHAPVNMNGNQGSTGVKYYGLSHLCIFADKLSA
jgi:hypothetical protein